MEDTWGISGPDFISLYLLAVLVSLLFAFAVRILTRSGTVTTTAPEALTALEVACLTGGPRRVVEAAVAQLVDTGQLRPARNGYVRVTNLIEPTNEVERTILADVRKHGHRSIAMLTYRLGSSQAVKDVSERLVRAGYLIDEKIAARRKMIGTIPIIVVLGVGIIRWLNGLGNDKPIGWLTLLLLGTGLVVYGMRRQDLTLRTFQATNACQHMTGASPAESVATGGLRQYPDLAVRESLLAMPDHTGSMARAGDTATVAGGTWWGGAVGGAAGGSGCGG
jgi:uncharacterized protein (TIGR04222 family)